MQITSATNPKFRFWLGLAKDSTMRRDHQQILIDGDHLVRTWIERFGMPQTILVNIDHPSSSEHVESLREYGTAHYKLPARLFKQLFEHASPGSVAAVVAIPKASLANLGLADVVFLDRVQDPGNLGTIMRSMSAAGFKHLITSPGCAQIWSPKVLRAAMGAHFLLECHEGYALKDVADRLPARLLAARLDNATSLYGLNLTTPCTWLFGSEGQGLSEETMAVGQQIAVRIPQTVEQDSLNVAMAVTVCLFEQLRQRQHGISKADGLPPA